MGAIKRETARRKARAPRRRRRGSRGRRRTAKRVVASGEVEGRKRVDHVERAQRDGDHPAQQVEDGAVLAVLGGPVVRVVPDARGLAGRDLVLVQHPVESRARAQAVVVGAQRDAGDRDGAVVEHVRPVLDLLPRLGIIDLRVAHLLDAPGVRVEARRIGDLEVRPGLARRVAHVKLGERAARLRERPEVLLSLHLRDAGERLLEISGEGLAVVARVQDAVDVEEEILGGEARIEGAVGREGGGGDAHLSIVRTAEQRRLLRASRVTRSRAAPSSCTAPRA